MRILITNDDGINAPGIKALADAFNKEHEVIVVAPDSERSACSHSLSINRDIVFHKNMEFGCKAFSVCGTPADCVKLGVLYLLENKPDIIISGINNGSNLGSDIMYSGTVSAAFEAAYLGFPAIAISLTKWNCSAEIYVQAAQFLKENFSRFISVKLPTETVLNINCPINVPYKGVKVTKVGLNLYDDSFVDGDTCGAVRLKGQPIPHNFNAKDCDVEWSKLGYATVSAIHLDKNDYASLKKLKKAKLF